MALIGTIRKNFWFVLILLGLALVAFIFMDMNSAGNMGGGATFNMGSIDGEEIDYREFQAMESALYSGQGDVYQKRDNLWNYMVEKSIVKKEAEGLGLYVSEDELSELEFGANPSQIVQQNFRNPQTGQFDRASVQSLKQQIDDGSAQSGLINYWSQQRKQILKTSLEDKLKTIVSKSLYTPTWMAEEVYKEQEGKVNFSFVKVPFANVADDQVSLTDNDYQSYLAANAMDYTNKEETRSFQYVAINVVPTPADSAKWRGDMEALVPDFRRSENDSLFAISNKGFYANYYFNKEELPDTTESLLETMSVGDIVGPYMEANSYRIAKLIDRQVVPDSVKARHILRSAIEGDAASFAAARSYTDSLLNRLNRGVESFDSLAIKNSQDPGSIAKGGDLGYFQQGRMLPAFNEVSFFTGTVGNYHVVESRVGVHLIHLQDRKYNDRNPKYKVAYIGLPIIPTTETQEAAYEKAADLIASYPYLADLVAAVNESGEYDVETVHNIAENGHTLESLGGGNTSRDIVKYLYTTSTSPNDVSPDVHTYSDAINFYDNKYVIGGLSEVKPAGLQSIDAAKTSIATLVMNQKKGEYLKSQISGTDLTAIANQYGTTVQSMTGIASSAQFVPELGNEPIVLAAANALQPNQVSKPIVGTAGTYVVRVDSKTDAGAPNNIPQLRRLQSANTRNQTNFQLMEALKKGAKVEDGRSTFF